MILVATQLLVLPSINASKLDIGKQRLYRYFWVLCVLKSITQSITFHVIKKKTLVVNTSSILYILHTLKHVSCQKGHYIQNWNCVKDKSKSLFLQNVVWDTVVPKLLFHTKKHTSGKFLTNTAPQTTCYFNLDHIMFLHYCESQK
jgi:hypothetical protein